MAINRGAAVGPQVYEAIREAILDLTLAPGSALSEKELSLEIGVSRTPIREAFIRLAREGLVVVYAQTGTFVSKIDPHQVAEGRFVREALERATVAEAAEKVTPADLEQLDGLLRAQRALPAQKTWNAFFELDEAFHKALILASGHPLAWTVSRELRAHVERLRRLSLPAAKSVNTLIDQHEEILEAVRARDPEAAQAAMSRHLSEAARVVPVLASEHPDYFTSPGT
jgi:DNA-binding GntR family transcriptional regulator